MNRSLTFVSKKLGEIGLLPKALTCFVFGALSTLAMPPFDAWWLLGLTIPVLLLLIEGQSHRRSFFLGWLFGFGYFLVVLHWIGVAFLVNAATDLWMMPFAVGGLSAAMAVYWGIGAAFTRLLIVRGFPLIFVMPICFGTTEYLRGILFSGFPWAVPGLAVDGMGGVSQLAYLVGMNGLTFLILLWALTPLLFLQGRQRIALVIFLTLPLAWGWGEWRLVQNPTQYVEGVNLRIVQPNLSQDDKWRNDHAREIFEKLLALSAEPSKTGNPITHVIWPESIIPFLIDESPEGLARVAQMLGPEKILLAGAVRRSSPSSDADYFTSVLVIDGKAKVLGHYDKSHLVPGGEYLPLAWALEPLGFRRVVNMPDSFRAGLGAESIAVPGAGFAGIQICYEAIFPSEAVDSKHRPDWLVNVTNDGWFGKSTGPYQHLAQLRLRTIEQGLAAARSANTGISAVFDPFGRALFQSEIDVEGGFDSPMPKSIAAGLYAKFGDYVLLMMSLVWFLFGWYFRKSYVLLG